MSNVQKRVLSITEHQYIIPVNSYHGADWKDFHLAYSMAEKQAKQLGVSTTTDNWSKLTVSDDEIIITVVAKE